jgi:8-oxo-dGTP pyrophosphatase MutT (NUDIX family)
MGEFSDSYIGQLRQLLGNKKIIVPGVRALVKDQEGRILLIKRKDTKRWGMPSGSIELDESVFDCVVREVKEETGIDVQAATPIALYTHPRYSFSYPNGDQVKGFIVVFIITEWSGEIIKISDETLDVQFFLPTELPDTHETYLETIEDSKHYNGNLILK